MPGLDADTSVYALSRPNPEAMMQPLDMLGKAVNIQQGMNQNALFQQEFRAKQALGPIAQASVGQDGQMDWNKFAVNVARSPDTAFMAPQIISTIAQRQNLEADTIGKNLANHAQMFNSLAASLLPAARKGELVGDEDIAGAGSRALAMGVPKDWILSALADKPDASAKVSVPDPQTGQPVMKSALNQWVQQHLQTASVSGANITKVLGEITPTETGASTIFTNRNPALGTVSTVGGNAAVIGKGPTPESANQLVPTYNPQTGQTDYHRNYEVSPMIDSTGQPVYNRGAAAAAAPAPGSAPTVAKQSAFGQHFSENAATHVADYVDGVNQGAHQAQQAMVTLNRQMDLLKKFRAGGGAYWRTEAAQAAQAIPVPKELEGAKADLVGKIQGGGPDALAAAQEFEKYAAIGAMQSLIQAQGSHYRPAAIEYQTIFKNFPRANIDPKASRDMIQLTRHLLQQNLVEQQTMEAYRAKFGNDAMISWPATWSRILVKNGWLGLDKGLYSKFGGKNFNAVQGAISGQQ